MFIVLKKKTIIIAIIAIVAIAACLIAGGFCLKSVNTTASLGQKIIVIDAGHGGSDKGVVGKNGTEESAKNLEIAYMLKARLEDAGFLVIMTRTKDTGADETGSFKQEDFARRKRTIENASPNMVISVHCNKFPSADRRGAQVFYNPLSRAGKSLAEVIQGSVNGLNSRYVGRTYDALGGEYFMLNLTDAPSVIVECGFLSNPDDEALLCDKDYLEKLVNCIYEGVITYSD